MVFFNDAKGGSILKKNIFEEIEENTTKWIDK